MNIYTVSLFGHRSLLNPLSVEEHLEHEVYKILKNHSYVKFLIGRTGEFDLMAALTIRRVKNVITNPLFRQEINTWLTVPIWFYVVLSISREVHTEQYSMHRKKNARLSIWQNLIRII